MFRGLAEAKTPNASQKMSGALITKYVPVYLDMRISVLIT